MKLFWGVKKSPPNLKLKTLASNSNINQHRCIKKAQDKRKKKKSNKIPQASEMWERSILQVAEENRGAGRQTGGVTPTWFQLTGHTTSPS